MRRSIPTKVEGFTPLPTQWYNANGHEWGYIGPRGELLDQGGNPTEPDSRTSWVWVATLWLGLVILFAALLVTATRSTLQQGPTGPVPTPQVYAPPPT